MATKAEAVLVVDANSIIVPAVHATARDDARVVKKFTGAVYSASMTVRRILEELQQQQLSVRAVYAAFDDGIPAFRRTLFPDYKQHRAARKHLLDDEELHSLAFAQIDVCHKLWTLLGIRCLSYAEHEADDVVAAVARHHLTKQVKPIIASSDRDLWQCVNWGATVYDTRHNQFIDRHDFRDRANGVPAESWLLYRALTGDSSDGLKGAPGCGPHRAQQLIVETAPQGPHEQQLRALCKTLSEKAKPRKFEEAVVASEAHVKKTLAAIDLLESFSRKRLAELKRDLEALTPVATRLFLLECKRLGFTKVLADPHRVLEPFLAVQRARG